MASENIVKLDVGGTIFKTSKSTLTKFNGFFKTILETGIPTAKDESGAIFIDRDPAHFRLILNFMRDEDVDLQKYSEDVKEIQKEAEFYGLEKLVKMCSMEIENRRIAQASKSLEKIIIQDRKSESSGKFVRLNVGGIIFETSKSTLTKFDGFFKTMLETGIPIVKDESGAIFIDRSPDQFTRVLQYMRYGHLALPKSSEDVKEIQKKAQYYLLEGLIKLCEESIPRKLNFIKTNDEFKQAIAKIENRKLVVIGCATDEHGHFEYVTTDYNIWNFVDEFKDRYDIYVRFIATLIE